MAYKTREEWLTQGVILLTKDGVNQLFISPTQDEPVRVLDVLAHEICHPIAGAKAGHRGQFKKIAWGIGLEGPMRATHAGPELEKMLKQFASALGKYPP